MIGMTRKEKSNVIPGVAIATALMPPLCTCGYGIAHGNLPIFLGAGYLFLVNSYFIFLSSALVLLALNVPRKGNIDLQKWKKLKRRLILNTILMLIPSLIVAWNMVRRANEDVPSVTGFETTVSVEQVTQEIHILFPEVNNIKTGSMEYMGPDGELLTETGIIIYLSEEMNPEDSKRLEQWLNKVYDENCNVIYQLP